MDPGLASQTEEALETYHGSMSEYRLHEAMAAAMDLARQANGYVEAREPWAQAKDPAMEADLDETLTTLARVLSVLACLFEPVMPGKSRVLAARLGLGEVPAFSELDALEVSGRAVTRGEPLFPKVDIPSEGDD